MLILGKSFSNSFISLTNGETGGNVRAIGKFKLASCNWKGPIVSGAVLSATRLSSVIWFVSCKLATCICEAWSGSSNDCFRFKRQWFYVNRQLPVILGIKLSNTLLSSDWILLLIVFWSWNHQISCVNFKKKFIRNKILLVDKGRDERATSFFVTGE